MSLISVLIPYYDDEKIFEKSIKSALNQTFTDIEILVCTNKNITPKIEKKLKVFKVDKKLTLKERLLMLLKNAGGKYIALNLSNAVYSYDYFRIMLEKQETDNVFCSSRIYFCDSKSNLYKLNNSISVFSKKIQTNSGDFYTILNDCPEILSVENKLFDKTNLAEYLSDTNINEEFLISFIVTEFLSRFNYLYICQNVSIIVNDTELFNFPNKIKSDKYLTDFILRHKKNSKLEIIDSFDVKNYIKVPVKDSLKLDEIKREILCHDVISFDIFDTLILRPFWNPDDLFNLLEEIINEEFDIPDILDFKNLRIEAETMARQKNADSCYEITLDEIYGEFKYISCFNQSQLEWIKNKEKELEFQLCFERKTGVELFNFAKANNKNVIITSDMYLDKEFLEKLLTKIGCTGFSKFYLSNEYKTNKFNGGIYHIIRRNFEGKAILHIGDNYLTDCENSKKNGLDFSYLPKTEEILKRNHPISKFFNRLYCDDNFDNSFKIHSNQVFNTCFKLRMLWKMVANYCFDNPFVDYIEKSEFSAEHYFMGCSVGGLFAYTFISEILRQKDDYNSIVLAARDSYVLNSIFEQILPAYKKIKYCKLSRKSLFPLTINETAGIQLNSIGLVNEISPFDIYRISKDVFNCNENDFQNFCIKNKYDLNKKFENLQQFNEFTSAFVKEYFSNDKLDEEKNKYKTYFDNFFSGKSLFVDLGYSGRCESLLKTIFNYDITSLYLLHRGENFDTRKIAKNLNVSSLFPFQGMENMWLRELLNSDLAGSCIGYKYDKDGVVSPIEKKEKYEYRNISVIKAFQQGMIDYNVWLNKKLGNYLKYFYLPDTIEGVLPFELFLVTMNLTDKKSFIPCSFEDNMGLGDFVPIDKLWNFADLKAGDVSFQVFLNSLSKKKKFLFFFLFQKKVFHQKVSNRLHTKWYYKYLKKVYHIMKRQK